jgi:cytochrome c oxidase assembly protein subunit 11
MLKLSQKNKKTATTVITLVLGMFILAFASFPLYNLFCKVTGYDGTPVIAQQDYASKKGERSITVRFNADINNNLPWEFSPVQTMVKVQTGENKLIFYTAKNMSDSAIKGVATFNVNPEKASPYFNKVQCFCFEEQTLGAHEAVEMPVSFFIDPEIENDPNLSDVNTITLSYTFFKTED